MKLINDARNGMVEKKHGYAPVNGLNLYYEIEGTGKPLVYIPPGLGLAAVPEFATLTKKRQLITVHLQGRGRTADIDRPLSFEQDAEDVVGLLKHLEIEQADFFGECFGGVVATIIAIRYPERVRRVATYGSIFGEFQDANKPEMLAFIPSLTPDARAFQSQREHYQKVAPDPTHWPTLWSKAFSIPWSGFSREELMLLKAPVLIAVGDHDWVRLEHALETFALIPHAELAVIPDAGHFVLIAEHEKLLPVIETFLDAPTAKVPFATTETGYHAGITR
jgi:pimeloyl-ACP methyl ester carboxylesterase